MVVYERFQYKAWTGNIFGVLVFSSSSIVVTYIPYQNTWEKKQLNYNNLRGDLLQTFEPISPRSPAFFHSSIYFSFSSLYLYFRVSFISVMSPGKKMKIYHRFSFFIFLKKIKFDTDFLFFNFSMFRKEKIEHRFSFVICHFLISIKIKIEDRFSLFKFSMFREKRKLKINCRFLFFIFKF